MISLSRDGPAGSSGQGGLLRGVMWGPGLPPHYGSAICWGAALTYMLVLGPMMSAHIPTKNASHGVTLSAREVGEFYLGQL